MINKWTKEEINLLKEYRNTSSCSTLAYLLQAKLKSIRTPHAIQHKLFGLGIILSKEDRLKRFKPVGGIPWSKEEINYVTINYVEKTAKELATDLTAKFGHIRTHNSVKRVLQRYGVKLTSETRLERIRKYAPFFKESEESKPSPLLGISSLAFVFFAFQHRMEKNQRKIIPKKKSLEVIIEDIASIFEVTVRQLQSVNGKRSTEKVGFCRMLFCNVANMLHPGLTQLEIAHAIGYKEHSTVVYALQTVQDMLKVKDPAFMEFWDRYLKYTKVYVSHGSHRIKYESH